MAIFLEAEGLIHVQNAANAEFTLCGDAFDLDEEGDDYEQRETNRRVVTCPVCAAIILDLRGTRVA